MKLRNTGRRNHFWCICCYCPFVNSNKNTDLFNTHWKRLRDVVTKYHWMFIINFHLNMFRASLCPSSGDQRPRYCIWCIVLVLLDVVGSGCGALCCRVWALWRFLFCRTETLVVLTPYKTAPHNRYQPHPAEPEQYTKCSNGVFDLLKMGIMMPETCWDRS